jgi:hypothetical protein
MILLKSSSDFAWPWACTADEAAAERVFAKTYPAVHAHMKRFESLPGDKLGDRKGLRHREDHGRYWWELRPCAYYNAFEGSKIFWQAIQFYPAYSRVDRPQYGNNKTYILPTDDCWLLASLNSPLLWWISWRHFLHMKDEALSNDGTKFLLLPFRCPPAEISDSASAAVPDLVTCNEEIRAAAANIHDWLRFEFGLERAGRVLEKPQQLDADGFADAVRAALPRRRQLSAAEIARLKREHAETIMPARQADAEAQRLERRLSDLVNRAYGLTPEEVALMWATAPPRMPLTQSTHLKANPPDRANAA